MWRCSASMAGSSSSQSRAAIRISSCRWRGTVAGRGSSPSSSNRRTRRSCAGRRSGRWPRATIPPHFRGPARRRSGACSCAGANGATSASRGPFSGPGWWSSQTGFADSRWAKPPATPRRPAGSINSSAVARSSWPDRSPTASSKGWRRWPTCRGSSSPLGPAGGSSRGRPGRSSSSTTPGPSPRPTTRPTPTARRGAADAGRCRGFSSPGGCGSNTAGC